MSDYELLSAFIENSGAFPKEHLIAALERMNERCLQNNVNPELAAKIEKHLSRYDRNGVFSEWAHNLIQDLRKDGFVIATQSQILPELPEGWERDIIQQGKDFWALLSKEGGKNLIQIEAKGNTEREAVLAAIAKIPAKKAVG